MKSQQLVALQKFPYGGKNRRPGDVFQATPAHARLLIALKRAQADPAPQVGRASVPAKVAETSPVALVTKAMGMSSPPPRPRGRPRRAAEQAE